MIVVTIEVWPKGEKTKATLLGVARISNDGTGDATWGNYNCELSHSGKYVGTPGVWKKGKVLGHERGLSPYHLVLRALQCCLKKYD